MFKALLKKQFLSFFSGVFYNRKAGKRRGITGIIGFSILFLFLLLSLFLMFLGISDALCSAFVNAGMDWLYFALMGLIGLMLSVIGAAFMSYSALFQAKDNELLMSMPIPPAAILFTRMLSIWGMCIMAEFLSVAAAVVQYGFHFGFSGRLLVCGILLILFSSFLALALCCLLGWLVALLMSKVHNKNIATVVFTLGFLGIYYTVYFRLQSILMQMVQMGDELAAAIKTWIYPIYQFGLAAAGDNVALLKYAAICVALMALVYWMVARSFIRIATSDRGTVKKEYKAAPQKAQEIGKALLRKELRHFLGSPAYMLNAGLAVVVLPIAAVAMIVKRETFAGLTAALAGVVPVEGIVAVVALSMLAAVTCFNDITAPSVSIEGKTIWITQSMPIDLVDFLMAKEKLHLLLTWIPALPMIAAAAFVFKLNLVSAVLLGVAVLAFVQMHAALGLLLNLKMPKLDWQNETQAVKSSLSALIAIFGGWLMAVLPSLAMLLLNSKKIMIDAQIQLAFWLVFYVLAARLMNSYIVKKGPEIIRGLSA